MNAAELMEHGKQPGSRVGTLEFKNGAPGEATLEKVWDNLDFTRAFEAFVNTFQDVNMNAIRNGLLSAGVA
jgi:hypothetical protein